ncbi:hypothetical protein PoB_007347400 [Plakobranchus ocellatus]|uniref:Uncharacterized protein n=1 Tax=Plakobranchus ocellatus TaxID=259542 RepID=A0AAV4DS31_9GAST|nr:hypothetical protein PoB_007347400 [Plakobranchus ocellatus]
MQDVTCFFPNQHQNIEAKQSSHGVYPAFRIQHSAVLNALQSNREKSAEADCAAGGFNVAQKSAAASRRQFLPATAWFEGGEGGAKLIWLESKVFRYH